MDDGARPLRRGTGPIGHTEDVPGAHVSARELSFEQKVACAWACTASFLQRWKYAFLLGCTTLDSTWHYPSAASTSMDLDDDTDDPSLLHYGLIAARHALESTRSLDKVLRHNRPRKCTRLRHLARRPAETRGHPRGLRLRRRQRVRGFHAH